MGGSLSSGGPPINSFRPEKETTFPGCRGGLKKDTLFFLNTPGGGVFFPKQRQDFATPGGFCGTHQGGAPKISFFIREES